MTLELVEVEGDARLLGLAFLLVVQLDAVQEVLTALRLSDMLHAHVDVLGDDSGPKQIFIHYI